MPNFSRIQLRAVARLLNGGEAHGSLATLAEFCGVSRQTVKGWLADESTEHARRMSRSARRLVATLAFFGAAGLLDREKLAGIRGLESILIEDTRRFDEIVELLVRGTQSNEEEEEEDDEDR